MIKIILKAIVVVGGYLGLQQLIEVKTRGFCLQRIQADDLPFQSQFETAPLSQEEQMQIDHLLSQPYRMIGAGSECFAFVSEDDTAVIKFFKLDPIRPVYLHRGAFIEDHSALAGTLSNHPLTKWSNPLLKRILGIREFRLQRTFQSIKLSYDALKEETGLLYLHLNPTNHFHRTLTLYDPCGIAHEIDLDQSKFFLQKKAIPLERHFDLLKEKNEDTLAKKSIDSLIDMILKRCKKGFADRDILNRNLGFIGTTAIEIDSGSFRPNPEMKQAWLFQHELYYATLELKAYLKKHYPEMVPYLEDRVDNAIRPLT